MNNKGKISFTFLIGLLLLFGVIVVVLELNGFINIRALFGGEGTFIVKDYEKEVAKLCNKIDENGNYNKDSANEIKEEVIKIAYEDTIKGTEYDVTLNNTWSKISGLEYCEDSVCYMFEFSEGRNQYRYNCKNSNNEVLNFDEVMDKAKAESVLDVACENLDDKGEYEYSSVGISCKNSYCNMALNGRLYNKDCKEK